MIDATSIAELREEMAEKLPRFREIMRAGQGEPDIEAFLSSLEGAGIHTKASLNLFLERDPYRASPTGWEDFWTKAEEPIKAHTPQALQDAEEALAELKFYSGNIEVWLPREKFRTVVEAVMEQGGRGRFESGKQRFWKEIRALSAREGGPRRIPKRWVQHLQNAGLPQADPIEVLRPHLSTNWMALESRVSIRMEMDLGHFLSSRVETWEDPEAYFHFRFPEGVAEIHHAGGLQEGYRGAMLHSSMPYSYGTNTFPPEKNTLNHWARFLLLPHRFKAARGFHALLQEADRQGTDCLYKSPE